MGEFQGLAHVVADGQDIAGEIGGGIERRFGLFALGALADIFHLGERPQQAVLELADLFLQRQNLAIAVGIGGHFLAGNLLRIKKI